MDALKFFATIITSTVFSGALASWITRRYQEKVLRQAQLVETIPLFAAQAAMEHCYPPQRDGSPVGLGEQFAAIEIVSAIGQQYPVQGQAAEVFLDGHSRYFTKPNLVTNEEDKFLAIAEVSRNALLKLRDSEPDKVSWLRLRAPSLKAEKPRRQ